MGDKGQTVRLKPAEWGKVEKAAVKLTIKRQKIVKPSDIVHRLVNDYLADCVDAMMKDK